VKLNDRLRSAAERCFGLRGRSLSRLLRLRLILERKAMIAGWPFRSTGVKRYLRRSGLGIDAHLGECCR
jgi:hypothetical protein